MAHQRRATVFLSLAVCLWLPGGAARAADPPWLARPDRHGGQRLAGGLANWGRCAGRRRNCI